MLTIKGVFEFGYSFYKNKENSLRKSFIHCLVKIDLNV